MFALIINMYVCKGSLWGFTDSPDLRTLNELPNVGFKIDPATFKLAFLQFYIIIYVTKMFELVSMIYGFMGLTWQKFIKQHGFFVVLTERWRREGRGEAASRAGVGWHAKRKWVNFSLCTMLYFIYPWSHY